MSPTLPMLNSRLRRGGLRRDLQCKLVGLLVVVGVLFAGAVRAEEIEEVEDVEVVETVEVVQTVNEGEARSDSAHIEQPASPGAATSRSSNPTAGTVGPFLSLLGRFHAAAVHLPIGLLLALLLVELIAFRKEEPCANGLVLGVVALLAFVPASVTGLLRAGELEALGSAGEGVGGHRNTMLAAFVLLLGAVVFRFLSRKDYTNSKRVAFIALVTLVVLLAFAGAHLGGKLVYGPDFLPF